MPPPVAFPTASRTAATNPFGCAIAHASNCSFASSCAASMCALTAPALSSSVIPSSSMIFLSAASSHISLPPFHSLFPSYLPAATAIILHFLTFALSVATFPSIMLSFTPRPVFLLLFPVLLPPRSSAPVGAPSFRPASALSCASSAPFAALITITCSASSLSLASLSATARLVFSSLPPISLPALIHHSSRIFPMSGIRTRSSATFCSSSGRILHLATTALWSRLDMSPMSSVSALLTTPASSSLTII